MNIIHLTKKDFLIGKKYILLMMFFAMLVPFFIAWRAPMLNGLCAFLFGAIFTEFLVCQQVSLTESKYPKASVLICATPYSRSSVVVAKYLFFLIIFAICFIEYGIVAMVVPDIRSISPVEVLVALAVCAVPYSIYMPFQFKFGFEKTKFAFMLLIFGFSFGMPLLYASGIQIDLSSFTNMSLAIQCTVLALPTVAVMALSTIVSIAIFKNKEL